MQATILSIELSTPAASIALWQKGSFMMEREWQTNRDHTEIFTHLKKALDSLGGEKINLILVGSGPGSYGGVRVALAAADGISLAQGSDIAAVCSWEALFAPNNNSTWVIANARRNGWVTGNIQNGRISGDLAIIPTSDMPAWIEERATKEEQIFSTESPEMVQKAGLPSVIPGVTPTARLLVESWLAKTPDEQETSLKTPPSPIYVRPPHITPAKTPPWFVQT